MKATIENPVLAEDVNRALEAPWLNEAQVERRMDLTPVDLALVKAAHSLVKSGELTVHEGAWQKVAVADAGETHYSVQVTGYFSGNRYNYAGGSPEAVATSLPRHITRVSWFNGKTGQVGEVEYETWYGTSVSRTGASGSSPAQQEDWLNSGGLERLRGGNLDRTPLDEPVLLAITTALQSADRINPGLTNQALKHTLQEYGTQRVTPKLTRSQQLSNWILDRLSIFG